MEKINDNKNEYYVTLFCTIHEAYVGRNVSLKENAAIILNSKSDTSGSRAVVHYYHHEDGDFTSKNFISLRFYKIKNNSSHTTHSYGDWEKYDEDYHAKTCSVCGQIERKEPHTFEKNVFREATHTQTGIIFYTCTVCGYKRGETVPKLTEHNFSAWAEISDTQHKRVCECGEVEVQYHTWDSGRITQAATHTSTGIRTYTCTACGATKTEIIAKTSSHSYGPWTELNDLQHYRTCACGEREIASHTWDSGVVTKAATHTETGIKIYTCTACGATKTEVIATTSAHSFGAWTYLNDALHQRVCSCGETETEFHTWNEGVVIREATISQDGLISYTCTVCGAVITEPITYNGSALGYNRVNIDRIYINANVLDSSYDVKSDDPIDIYTGDKLYILGWAVGAYSNLKEIVYSIDYGSDIKCQNNYRDRFDVTDYLDIDWPYGEHSGFGHDSAEEGGMMELTGIDKLPAGYYTLTLKAIFNDNTYESLVYGLRVYTRYYDIYYYANGGEGEPASQTKIHGTDIVLSTEKPTKSYTITYDANGGSISRPNKTVNCGFKNWNTEWDGSGKAYAPGGKYSADADAYLYAQWNNPGTGTLATPKRPEYEFVGWFTSAYGGTEVTTSTVITGNITIYAHWRALEKFTVSYSANGGTGAPSSQTKLEDTDLTLSSDKPTKSYTITYDANGGNLSASGKPVICGFKNWNTRSDGSGKAYALGGTYSANESTTLYAQWNNPKAATLATPKRTGYEFIGWFTSANGGTQIDSSTVITGNITVYARWKSDGSGIVTLKGDVNGDGKINNKDVVALFRYVSSGEIGADLTIYDFNDDSKINNKDVVALFRYVSSN